VSPFDFETTCWSDVLASAETESSQGHAALNRLCHAYWRPIYFFLRRTGCNPHDAEDHTQEFFADLLRRSALKSVHPSKGRFRTFVIASLKNFMGHVRERAAAQKRGGGCLHLDLEDAAVEAAYHHACPEKDSPDGVFDRQWVWTVLERVRERLAGEYAAAGRSFHFQILADYLPGRFEPKPQEETARVLGLSVSAVKSEIYRMRQRFGQYLRLEIANTVASPDEIDQEIRHLLGLMRPDHE
jgi:RNA polymerase sigma-70 factor (ECF subfamily)